MLKYNTDYTTEEYLEQGFTLEEIPLVREHNILFDLDKDGLATEEQRERMFYLIDLLKL